MRCDRAAVADAAAERYLPRMPLSRRPLSVIRGSCCSALHAASRHWRWRWMETTVRRTDYLVQCCSLASLACLLLLIGAVPHCASLLSDRAVVLAHNQAEIFLPLLAGVGVVHIPVAVVRNPQPAT